LQFLYNVANSSADPKTIELLIPLLPGVENIWADVQDDLKSLVLYHSPPCYFLKADAYNAIPEGFPFGQSNSTTAHVRRDDSLAQAIDVKAASLQSANSSDHNFDAYTQIKIQLPMKVQKALTIKWLLVEFDAPKIDRKYSPRRPVESTDALPKSVDNSSSKGSSSEAKATVKTHCWGAHIVLKIFEEKKEGPVGV
jgi:hypothetical protein